MTIPATNDYGYALALRRAARTPASIAAIADVETPAWQYGEAVGRRNADTAATTLTRDLQEKKIGEAAREANLTRDLKLTYLDRARELMDVWADQNKWATAIGTLNLGVTGFMGLGQIEEQKRRDAVLEQLRDAYVQLPTRLSDAATAAAKAQQEWLRTYVRRPEEDSQAQY